MGKIGFIGGGNMAEALIQGILNAELYEAEDIYVSDISSERLVYLGREYSVNVSSENAEVASTADIVVIAVKPQVINEALESIADEFKSGDKVAVSIAAGIPVKSIKKVLGDVPVVRVMPNTPALIGEGASALFADEKARQHLEQITPIFSAVGKDVVLDDESLIDAVTAISGSGPAYFFLMMESLIHTAVEMGLSADIAEELVLHTASGAAGLALESTKDNINVTELRRRVASPGGTTEAALEVFKKAGFKGIVRNGAIAAYRRSHELSAS